MNNTNSKKIHIGDIVESKYDSQCSITECVTEYNECHECNICRKPMCTSHSHYINKKHKETPIICYKCMDNPIYHDLIGAYVLHFNTSSKLHNCWQRFLNIGRSTKQPQIKPL